jgi:hypothetical protein
MSSHSRASDIDGNLSLPVTLGILLRTFQYLSPTKSNSEDIFLCTTEYKLTIVHLFQLPDLALPHHWLLLQWPPRPETWHPYC